MKETTEWVNDFSKWKLYIYNDVLNVHIFVLVELINNYKCAEIRKLSNEQACAED